VWLHLLHIRRRRAHKTVKGVELDTEGTNVSHEWRSDCRTVLCSGTEVSEGENTCPGMVPAEIPKTTFRGSDGVSPFLRPPWERNTSWFDG
jgi:hypothetical protein